MSSDLSLWGIFIAVGLGTFALRLSFIGLYGRLRVPPLLQRALAYVPASVLAALVLPAVVYPGGQGALVLANPQIPAAIVAAWVAWKTRSTVLTLAVGMAVLWVGKFLFGRTAWYAGAALASFVAVSSFRSDNVSTRMNAWWQEVWNTLVLEFADITDASQLTRVTLRLLMAAVLGGVLGFERESQGKSAGVRTHMLVSLGAALFVLVPSLGGAEQDAMSRVVQGVVAGIGFLGAGTILKNSDLDTRRVKGLTTAAGLWMTAAIGVAAGMGKEATALLSTLLALLVFSVVPWFLSRFGSEQR